MPAGRPQREHPSIEHEHFERRARGTSSRGLCQRLNNRVTLFGHNVRMASNTRSHCARPMRRTDFAAIESDLQFVMGQRLPGRRDLAQTALLGILTAAAFVLVGIETFGRRCLLPIRQMRV